MYARYATMIKEKWSPQSSIVDRGEGDNALLKVLSNPVQFQSL